MARTISVQTIRLAITGFGMAVVGLALSAASGWKKDDPLTPLIVIGTLLFLASMVLLGLAVVAALRDWLRRRDERSVEAAASAIGAWGSGIGPAPGTTGPVVPLAGLRSLTRSYRGRTEYAVAERHRLDAEALANRGFREVACRYEGGAWTGGQWVLAFASLLLYVGVILVPYMFLARPPRRMVATFERDEPSAAADDLGSVQLACEKCGKALTVPAAAQGMGCPSCGTSQQFLLCTGCGLVSQVTMEATTKSWSCQFCGRANAEAGVGGWRTGNAGQRHANLAARSITGGAPYTLVGGFLVLGGSGYGLEPGSRLSIVALADRAVLTREEADGHQAVTVRYSDLTALEASGGKQTSSPGFIGGGFGLKSAVKGIAVASVLNAALSTTSVNTGVHIASTSGEVLLHHPVLESQQIRLLLSKMWAGYAAAQHVPMQAPAADPATLLARLGELRQSGVLTEEEFEAKKHDILSRM
jgi:hypothetical protein